MTTETFYWDLNDRTRAFTKRVLPKTPNNYPNQAHASGYGITLHYLKAAAAMGAANASKSGRDTVAKMKSMPTDDDAFGKGSIRADGRGVFPAYLFEVKKPAESKYPWDFYKLLQDFHAGRGAASAERQVQVPDERVSRVRRSRGGIVLPRLATPPLTSRP